MNNFVFKINLCRPHFVFVIPSYSYITTCFCNVFILAIFPLCNNTEIFPTVVESVAIDMVDLFSVRNVTENLAVHLNFFVF